MRIRTYKGKIRSVRLRHFDRSVRDRDHFRVEDEIRQTAWALEPKIETKYTYEKRHLENELETFGCGHYSEDFR